MPPIFKMLQAKRVLHNIYLLLQDCPNSSHKFLYLAHITALTSIIYSCVYNVIIATHWEIGEKQLTIVYFKIWNHLKCI